jgi:hypothetical protein
MKNIEINFLNKQYSLECSPKVLDNCESKGKKMMKKIKRQLSVNKEQAIEDSCEIMQISYSSMASSMDKDLQEMEEQEVCAEEEVSDGNDQLLSSSSHWSPLNDSNINVLNHRKTVRLMKFDWEFCDEKDLSEIRPDVVVAAGRTDKSWL